MDSLQRLLVLRPHLKTLLDQHGHLTLKNYVGALNTDKPMQKPLLETIRRHTDVSVSSHTLLHTADHMGMLHHPFFWSLKAVAEEPLFVLATSNISPANSSLPRSLSWHDDALQEKRAHLLSLAWKSSALYFIPAQDEFTWRQFSRKLPDPISTSLLSLFDNDFFEKKWLSEQFSKISERLWQEILPERTIYYLELETVVNDLLIEQLQTQKGSFWHLCNEKDLREAYSRNFASVTGAHSLKDRKGSFLFWGVDSTRRRRVPLRFENDHLVAEDGEIFSFDPYLFKDKLTNRTLMPTLALSYGLLANDHGATLAGGFSQIDYLPKIQQAWSDTFSKPATSQGSIFAGEGGLMTLSNEQGSTLATLLDLLIYLPDISARRSLVGEAADITLAESVTAIAPLLVKILEPDAKLERLEKPLRGDIRV